MSKMPDSVLYFWLIGSMLIVVGIGWNFGFGWALISIPVACFVMRQMISDPEEN